jgi:hypothetical protein
MFHCPQCGQACNATLAFELRYCPDCVSGVLLIADDTENPLDILADVSEDCVIKLRRNLRNWVDDHLTSIEKAVLDRCAALEYAEGELYDFLRGQLQKCTFVLAATQTARMYDHDYGENFGRVQLVIDEMLADWLGN